MTVTLSVSVLSGNVGWTCPCCGQVVWSASVPRYTSCLCSTDTAGYKLHEVNCPLRGYWGYRA